MMVSGIIYSADGYSTSTSNSSSSTHTPLGVQMLSFSPTLFFFGLLPPVIYSSGYHMKRYYFYRNILPILSLAVLGTCVSVLVVALGMYYGSSILSSIYSSTSSTEYSTTYASFTWMECVAYGALISSTDPISTLAIFQELRVDTTLFYVVFGESVLNDAIAITIFKVATSYVSLGPMSGADVGAFVGKFLVMFLGSCVIGYSSGIITALLFKYFPSLHLSNLTVICIFISTVYLPFLLAGVCACMLLCYSSSILTVICILCCIVEALQLSGIVTILFTGIAARR